MKLTKILENAINIKLNLVEAKELTEKQIIKLCDDYFSDANLAKINYSSHKNSIQAAYKKYKKNKPNYEVLNLFVNRIKSFSELVNVIQKYGNDPFLVDLYNIAAKDSQTGRGGTGRAEVLIGMLAGEESGGQGGVDNSIGGRPFEVKAQSANNIKIPLAAKRVARLISLSRLDDIYAICKPAMTAVPKSWDKFLKDRNASLNDKMVIKSTKSAKMTSYLFNSGYAPSNANVNQTELNNYKKFFAACHELYYGDSVDVDNEDLYIDIDSPSGKDKLVRGKLDSPKDLGKITAGSKVAFNVTTAKSDNSRVFQRFENQLKEHPYVKNKVQFEKDLVTDCRTLMGNFDYIVFHEKSDGAIPKPFIIKPGSTARISTFTLGSVQISYGKPSSEDEE